MTTKSKQPREFKDHWHEPVSDKFYDLMEAAEHDDDDVLELINTDPDYFDPYLYLADLYRDEDKDEKGARELEAVAFERALLYVLDSNDEWPDTIPWGFMENRHIVRALARGADNFWKDGRIEEALEIYRKLLQTNLNDNIGARYSIVGLRLGLSYDDYIQEVWPEPTMPADHIDNWFSKHAPK